MASFGVTTDTQSGQSVLAGEFGFVAAQGSIVASPGPAVEVSATAKLMSYGVLAALNASAIVLNDARSTSVTIGAAGSVVTGAINLAAISGSFSDQVALQLSGMVSGGMGLSLAASKTFSTLNIGNDGILRGLGFAAGHAIVLTLNQGSTAAISNTGTISTAGTGATIKVAGQWGGTTLTNTGDILNASATQCAIDVVGDLTLRNSGRIEGGVTVKDGVADITCSGTVHGDIKLSGFADIVRISGVVMGNVILGDGANVFWLTGGRVMDMVCGGLGDDTYRIDLSDTVISDTKGGIDVVYASASFRLAAGLENLVLLGPQPLTGIGNAGANIIQGDTGNDVIWGLGGNDILNGGEGDNRLMGGTGADTLRGGEGSDRIAGGPGADTVFVSLGNDKLFGGAGRDVLRFDELTSASGVTANLATNKASFEDQGDSFRFIRFEDLVGTAYADALTGSDEANTLAGGGGADTLSGGAGDDVLIGGAQGDVMSGGLGADTFVYTSKTDSPMGGVDMIQEFDKGQDKIDLSAIDAVLGGADDAFGFIGTQAFGAGGACVRYQRNETAGTTLIELHLAGSSSPDMQIVLSGLYDLTAASFVL
jgi:Ca2+-binding RTX toxin-like protein